MSLTPTINNQNVRNMRVQIEKKKGSSPYYATISQSSDVVTDYDTFPYPRWFRGVPDSTVPIVAEREAGWRPVHKQCYEVLQPPQEKVYPRHCFEGPCSTVYPCYPEYLTKYADREALNVMLNKACIAEYR